MTHHHGGDVLLALAIGLMVVGAVTACLLAGRLLINRWRP